MYAKGSFEFSSSSISSAFIVSSLLRQFLSKLATGTFIFDDTGL
jgi:hypothetical protein